MKAPHAAVLAAALLAAMAGAACSSKEAAMQLTTSAFTPGGTIPALFTADGADQSPALAWSGAPAGTQAYALIMDDPDAPVGLWVHWVVLDLPASAHRLEQGQPRAASLPGGGRQGSNSWGRLGWNGPSPPPGKPHRYFFRIYALNAPLGLDAGVTAAKVREAMKGRILAEGSVMGTYGR